MFSQEILWKTALTKQVQSNKPIHALSINHDASQIAVGVGKRVFIFDSESGKILRTLKGHRDEIYTVGYSHDGELLSTGGCDKSTIIWSKEGRGIVKFSFTSSVQVLAFNPLQTTLASCSNGEVGFWQPNNKAVKKTKVDSKILSVAWRSDGNEIVIGTVSGHIFVMDSWGSITRTTQRNAPIWALTWSVEKDSLGHEDGTLVVGSWDSKIAFYKDVELVKEINTKGFATSLSSINNRDSISSILYIVSSTEDGVSIMNQSGVVVSNFPQESDWVWCVQSQLGQNGIGKIVYVDNEASLFCLKLKVTPFLLVWDDIVISCENGSKLSIQNFRRCAHEAVRYECSSLILGLTVSSKHVYVLVENSLLVLEIQAEDESKLSIELVGTILVDVGDGAIIQSVDADKILLAWTTTLILYNARNGEIIKTWKLDSTIKCFDSKSCGCNKEVLVGCERSILRINKKSLEIREVMNVDFDFKHFSSSKCGTLLAILDQENSLHLFNIEEKRFLTSTQDAVSSFLLHDEVPELLCTFHNNDVSLCYKNVYSISSQFEGRKLVAFRGGDFIFFESGQVYVEKIDYGKLIEECVSVGEFQVSIQLAKYERNTEIWDLLATRALAKKRFDIAREVYSEIQDNEKMQMVERVKVFVEQNENFKDEESLLKLVVAERDALDGFEIDSIETFVSLNAFERAIELACGLEKGKDQVLRIIEKLPDPPLCSSSLTKCCDYLLNLTDINDVENLLRAKLEELQDCDLLLSFYVKSKSWGDVEKFFVNHKGEFDPKILIPYGELLAGKGDIKTALRVYRDASRNDKTDVLLRVLLRDAIAYESWDQVSKFLWLASKESDYREGQKMSIFNIKLSNKDLQILSRFFIQYYRITDFSAAATMTPATLFRACSYSLSLILQHQCIKDFLPTANVELLFLLSKLARDVHCYQTARFAYDMIALDYEVVLESKRKETLADDMMTIELMPMEDDEEFCDICFRCGSTQVPLKEGGQHCLACKSQFIRCNITFNILPVVEFKPSPSMDPSQVEILCNSEPDDGLLFNEALDFTLSNSQGVYKPVEVSENVLKSMDRCDIHILHGKYYKCMMKELGVAICHSCSSFYEEKELELYLSRYNTISCPVCSEKEARIPSFERN